VAAKINKYAVSRAGSLGQQLNFIQNPRPGGFFINERNDIFFGKIIMCDEHLSQGRHVEGWPLKGALFVFANAYQQRMIISAGGLGDDAGEAGYDSAQGNRYGFFEAI
jgi:hypothetical protein